MAGRSVQRSALGPASAAGLGSGVVESPWSRATVESGDSGRHAVPRGDRHGRRALPDGGHPAPFPPDDHRYEHRILHPLRPCGLFTYLFLRTLRVSWTGSVIGGVAYQLSGIVASYVQTRTRRKLVVSALMPLVLLGFVLGMRDRRPAGYAIAAIGVGVSILTQHVQITYYLLIMAGLFALYLHVPASSAPARRTRAPARPGARRRRAGIRHRRDPTVAGRLRTCRCRARPSACRAASKERRVTPFPGSPSRVLPQTVRGGAIRRSQHRPTGDRILKLHSEYLSVNSLAILVRPGEARRRLRRWLAAAPAVSVDRARERNAVSTGCGGASCRT